MLMLTHSHPLKVNMSHKINFLFSHTFFALVFNNKIVVIFIFFASFLKNIHLIDATASAIPEITSYAKVSRNGAASDLKNEARNFQDSPVYKKTSKINHGEVIEHPLNHKYSTLDEEMVAKLDAKTTRKQAQDRFHPPASFEHVIAHSNKLRLTQNSNSNSPSGGLSGPSPQSAGPSSSSSSSSSMSLASGSYATLPKQLYTQYSGYPPDDDGLRQSTKNGIHLPSITTLDDEFISPQVVDSYAQIPDSYVPQDSYQNDQKLPSFVKKPSAKPEEFSESSYHHSSYLDDPYLHNHDHDHIYHSELIYDHPPDHYDHDYTTTTEAPDMNDQRLSKRPYSYYYIGKKLWYIPLYFSIYFIIYIAALILKSIARHKINFPANLAEAAAAGAQSRHLHDTGAHEDGAGWWDLTQRVLEAIEKFAGENSKVSASSSSSRNFIKN